MKLKLKQTDATTIKRTNTPPTTRTDSAALNHATRRNRRKRRTSPRVKLLATIRAERNRVKPDTKEAGFLVIATLKAYRQNRIGYRKAIQAISDALGIITMEAARDALRKIKAMHSGERSVKR